MSEFLKYLGVSIITALIVGVALTISQSNTAPNSTTPKLSFKDSIMQAGGRKMTVGDSLRVEDAELYFVRIEESDIYFVVWNVYIDGKGFMGEIRWKGYFPAVFKNHTFSFSYDFESKELYIVEGEI